MQRGLHTAPGLALVQPLSRLLLPGRSLLGEEPSHMALNINQLAQKSCQGARTGSAPKIRAGRVSTASFPASSARRRRAVGSTRDFRSPSALPPHPNHRWSLTRLLHPIKKSRLLFPISQPTPLVSQRSPLRWALPNLHSPENWPKWLKIPKRRCWMSLQGTTNWAKRCSRSPRCPSLLSEHPSSTRSGS